MVFKINLTRREALLLAGQAYIRSSALLCDRKGDLIARDTASVESARWHEIGMEFEAHGR